MCPSLLVTKLSHSNNFIVVTNWKTKNVPGYKQLHKSSYLFSVDIQPCLKPSFLIKASVEERMMISILDIEQHSRAGYMTHNTSVEGQADLRQLLK